MQRVECVRCGTCCLVEVCDIGDEDEFGVCKHLIIESDSRTHCQLISSNENKYHTFIGTGCLLRGDKEVYAFYKELLTDQGKTLKHIKELRNGSGDHTAKTASNM